MLINRIDEGDDQEITIGGVIHRLTLWKAHNNPEPVMLECLAAGNVIFLSQEDVNEIHAFLSRFVKE